ncbi:MAG: hypothetical protein SF172_16700 [Burkholderiales bacterium]|nr:hypothetical protein [Burkholderiales bacterium]
MSAEPPAAVTPSPRSPIFAGASILFGLLAFLWAMRPETSFVGPLLEDAFQSFNIAAMIFWLIVWALFFLATQVLGFILLCVAALRREKPIGWLVVAVVIQLMLALLFLSDSVKEWLL